MIRSTLVAVVLVVAGCRSAYLEPLPASAQPQRARTRDGWELALVRYAAGPPVRGRPVLLCHGISANDRNMDLDAGHSMARWFAAQGRETWTLSLRGTGGSDRADRARGRMPGYDFDTLWREDLRAAIEHVRRQTGADSIDYVGHSMGGMLVYAYLSQGGEGLHAVATFGAPTRLDWGGPFQTVLPGASQLVLSADGFLPMESLSVLAVPLQGVVDGDPVQVIFYNPRNVDPGAWKRLMAYGTADISGALVFQMMDYVRTGWFGSADHRIDYRAAMKGVHTPVLVAAGKGDHLAHVMTVHDGYRALGGPKEWLLLSEENGVQADYGHMDMVIGDRAPQELWSRALDFFDRHAEAPAAR